MGFAKAKKDYVLNMLNNPSVKPTFPKELEFKWASKPVSLTSTKKEK